MQLLKIQSSIDYTKLVASLCEEFAATAAERDTKGGTPIQERNKLRESGLLKLIINSLHKNEGNVRSRSPVQKLPLPD